jgi:flavin reductase (DIM6/NTAB) family NADH-FMN oxidoreductase RutF
MNEYTPASLTPTERYKLLIGGITPRPIALVSTVSATGKHNLAPFSFFAGVGSDPMTLLFCPANTAQGHEKDTLANCKPRQEGGTGECVVNVVPAAIAPAMALCAEPLAHGESEFDLSLLTPAPSRVVAPPRVAQSPLSFECETMQVIRTNPGVASGGNVVLCRVVHVWVSREAINERLHLDPASLDTVGRLGGLQYCYTRDRFEMKMGRS